MDTAIDIVRSFLNGDYDSLWEDLVVPVLAALGVDCHSDRLWEIKKTAGNRLRRAFQGESKSRAVWNGRRGHWSDSDIKRTIQIIEESVDMGARQTLESEPVALGQAGDLFSPWILFRDRESVPDSQGVYLVGLRPEPVPSHLDRNVIYIGRAWGETVTVRSRLSDFHKTATSGKSAHSGGWSYWTHMYQDEPAKLKIMYATYCAWTVSEHAKMLEAELIDQFVSEHGRMPLLNKNRGER